MKANWLPILLFIIIAFIIITEGINCLKKRKQFEKDFAAYVATEAIDTIWHGSTKNEIPNNSDTGKLIWYGYQLIANTSFYLGPKGTVAKITNGMNCQNCHLEGGTLPFGNNFGKAYSTYPQFRARSNTIQSIYGRINDCLERSLNGKSMDSTVYEMKAIYAYIKWLGKGIPKGDIKGGTSIIKLQYEDTAANAIAGKQVYQANCQSCHGNNGQGQPDSPLTGYIYPPLWGQHSYNDGAGLYRLSSFAGFVKSNMPFGANYHDPKLSDEEAWNVAAFVNSKPRPHMDQQCDWKNIAKKPVDFPFGPYNDPFSEKQHKYGPFKPIISFEKSAKK